jgi:predicted nuclease of predicted toxin-antitoxin system
MNFFLDENFPKSAEIFLINRNHKVFDIRGSENEGMADLLIFELSKRNKAVFLTTDKDFYHTIHLLSKPHFGIVVIALSQPNADRIVSKLHWFIENFENTELQNHCFLFTDNNCKVFN